MTTRINLHAMLGVLPSVPQGLERLWLTLAWTIANYGQRGTWRCTWADVYALGNRVGIGELYVANELRRLPGVTLTDLDGAVTVQWRGFSSLVQRAAPAKKDDGAEKLPVGELLQHYAESYMVTFGAAPIIAHGRDRGAARTLLKTYGLEQAKSIVTEFLARPPRFFREKCLYNFHHVVSAAGQIIVRRKEEEL